MWVCAKPTRSLRHTAKKENALPYLSFVASFGFDPMPEERVFPLYKQLGCKTAQFYRNPAEPPTTEHARQLIAQAELSFDSLHGLFGSDLDPSSPDQATRQKAIDVYRAEGQLVRDLGGKMVVVHPAPMSPDAPPPSPPPAERVEALGLSLEQLASIGEELGVVYLIENLPGQALLGSDPVFIAQQVRQAASPHIRMCFDTGHAHMTCNAAEALVACADAIGGCHLNDNHQHADEHLFPGEGTLPWDTMRETFAALGEDVAVALELFPGPERLQQAIDEGYSDWLSHHLGLA